MNQDATMTGTNTSIELDQPPINLTRIGSGGDPVIVMHGWGQTQDSMRLLGDLLGKWQQVILIDLPGFGKSPKPDADWDTTQYAQRIARFIDEQNISPAHLVGHSFGGRVAIRLASHFPDKVRSIVLINSGGLKRTLTGKSTVRARTIKLLAALCKSVDKMFGAQTFQNWYSPKFASVDYLNAGPLRTIFLKAVNEDCTLDAQKITAPTFLLWGEQDTETPVEFGYTFNKLIKNSQLVVLPGKDHFPFVDEGAHLCASYILRFFKSLDRRAPQVVPPQEES